MTLWEKAWPILLVFGVLILILLLLPTKAAVSIVSFLPFGARFSLHCKGKRRKDAKGNLLYKSADSLLFCNRYPG